MRTTRSSVCTTAAAVLVVALLCAPARAQGCAETPTCDESTCVSMNGVCSAPACPEFTAQARCENNGCWWDSSDRVCKRIEPCESIEDEGDCGRVADCQWSRGFCVNYCQYHTSAVPCNSAAGCVFQATVGACRSQQCAYYSRGACDGVPTSVSCGWANDACSEGTPAPPGTGTTTTTTTTNGASPPGPAATTTARAPSGPSTATTTTTTTTPSAPGPTGPAGNSPMPSTPPAPPTPTDAPPAPQPGPATPTAGTGECSRFTNAAACYDEGVDCYWALQPQACVSAYSVAPASSPAPRIDGADTTPRNPSAHRVFSFRLYGASLNEGDFVLLVPTQDRCTRTNVEGNAATTTVTYSDPTLHLYEGSASRAAGTYFLCVASSAARNTAAVFVGGFPITITAATATVTSFTITTGNGRAFAQQQYRVAFAGTNLGSADTVSISPAQAGQPCPSVDDLSRYHPVSQVSNDGTSAAFTWVSTNPGRQAVCYAPAGATSAINLGTLDVVAASWFDPSALAAAAAAAPRLGPSNERIDVFNRAFCVEGYDATGRPAVVPESGMPPGYHAGPYIHPAAFTAAFGDTYNAYASGQRCAFAVRPADATATSIVRLEFSSLAVDTTDDVRIFAREGQHSISLCGFFSEATCPTRCVFADGTCQPRINRALTNCPDSIDGFELVGTMTYSMYRAGSRAWDLPASSGAIALVCTDSHVGAGTGFTMRYTVRESQCPNNCRDVDGVSRGQCRVVGTTFKCVCNEGYFGESCGSPIACSGTGAAAQAISSTGSGVRPVSFTAASRCGFSITVAPTETMTRMAVYGTVIELSGATLGSRNCSESAVRIRSASSTGTNVASLCADDFSATTSTLRFRVDSPTAYVEVRGVAGDQLSIAYSPISLVCPGPQGSSGVPAASDECSGRGTCIDVDLSATTAVPLWAKRCRCNAPLAPRTTYGTCDTCGFGYRPDTFPTCTKSTGCALDSECNGGVCSSGACACPSGQYGAFCERLLVTPASALVASTDNVLRLPFDGVAANAARSTGGLSDTTVAGCQLPGSPYPCVTERRTRGKMLVAGAATAVARNGSAASRRQSDTTQTNATVNGNDVGMKFNELVVDEDYRDFVRVANASGQELDVTMPLTITAWVRLTADTNGFLVAKVDTAFHGDGGAPALDRAANDVRSRTLAANELQLGADDLAVYWGVYLNGAEQRIDMIATTGRASATREDWHAVRHFRLGGRGATLFDGQWRFLAITLQDVNGRVEAQAYVDAATVVGDSQFAQCFPFAPKEVQPSVNVTDADVRVVESGGSIHVGYRLAATLNELRVYRRALTHLEIVRIGGTEFEGELAAPFTVLYVMAALCFVVVVACAALATRNFFLARAERLRREQQEQATKYSDDGDADEARAEGDDDPNVVRESTKARDAGGRVVVVSTAGPTAFAANNEDATPTGFEPEPEDDGGAGGAFDCVGDAWASAADDVAAHLTTAADQVKNSKANDAAAAGAAVGQSAQVGRMAVAGADGDAGNDAGGSEEGAIHPMAESALVGAAEMIQGLGETVAQGAEVMLRLNIWFGCWQIIALWIIGFDMPEGFDAFFGNVAEALALDLSRIELPVPFLLLYYLKIAIALVAFLVLTVIFGREEVKDREALLQEKEEEWRAKAEADERGEEYSAPTSGKQVAAFVCLFVVTSLYLPITRDTVVVVFCHSSVQCLFDCGNDPAHTSAMIVGVACLVVFTILLPVAVVLIVRRKKRDFQSLLGETYLEAMPAGERERLWEQFVKVDRSPYRSVYSGFEYDWVYFQAILMLVKALMCLATLALTPNSTEQLVVIILVQAVFSLTTFYSAPFVLTVCDAIMAVSQVYVMIILALSALQRADVSSGGLDMGVLVNTVSGCVLAVQVIAVLWPKAV